MEKTFGELSREEKLALLTAWVDGKQIQVRCKSKWGDPPHRAGMWNIHAIYRIASVTPITFDWSHLKSEYKYIAKDACGEVFAYTHLPEYNADSGFWHPDGSMNYAAQRGQRLAVVGHFTSLDVGTVEAKDSLIVRPE